MNGIQSASRARDASGDRPRKKHPVWRCAQIAPRPLQGVGKAWDRNSMKVLCFSPNDAVWLWAKPQAQVLKALKDRGDTIHYAHCDRTITDFCMAMAAS